MQKSILVIFSVLAIILYSNVFISYTYAEEDRTLEKYYIANALYNKGLYKLAINDYTSFIELYPDSPKILSAKLGLALSYYALNQLEKAEALFSELADNDKAPQQQLVHNLLGECLLKAGRPAEAEIAFRWCVEHGKERLFMELPGIAQKHSETPNISMATVNDLDPLERSYAGLIESLYQQNKWNRVITYTEELIRLAPKTEFANRTKLLSALSYYELKQYKESIVCLDNIFASKDSQFLPQAYLLLADNQFKLGDITPAKKSYNTVITEFKKSELACSALFRLGTIYYNEKAYDKASQQFSNLIISYPSNTLFDEANLYLGRCYLNQKNYSKAEAVFTKLSTSSKIECKATIWLARTYTRQNQLDKSEGILKNGMDKFTSNQNYPSLLFSYGEVLMLQNKYDQAIIIFNKALAYFKEGKFAADSIRLIAFAQNRKKSFSESLKSCDEFLDKFKNNSHISDVMFLKAENLYFLEKYEASRIIYQKFVSFDGSRQKYTNEAAYRLAEIYIKQKDYKQALENLSVILNEPPGDPFFEQLYYLAGYCAFKIKNYEKAILFFKEFMAQHPKDKNLDASLIYSALSYAETNNNKAAVPYLETLIKNYPDSFYLDQAYMELGKYYYSVNDYSKAQTNLETITENYKQSKFAPYAKYYLGWVALGNQDYDKAFHSFDSLVKDHPDHSLASDSQFQKAIVLIKQGKNKEAEDELKIFIMNYKSNLDEASFYYALAVARKGDAKESNTLFEKFLKDYPNSKLRGEALYEMAWNARTMKDADQAKKYYEKYVDAEKSDNKKQAIMFELAELEYDTKSYDRSLDILNKLLSGKINPELKEKILYRKAWCYMEKNQQYEAMKVFENLMYEFPNSSFLPVAAYQAGEKRLSEKEYEAAYSDFKKAWEKSSSTSSDNIKEQILLRLGETQTLTDRWIDANNSFKTFITSFPKSKFYYRAKMWSGWTLENLKRYQEAIEQYSSVVNTRQNSSIAARSQFQIGECYFSMKEFDKAIIAFIKVETDYDFPEWISKAQLETARVLMLQNKDKEANQILKKVITDYKGTEEASIASDILSSREEKAFD
ncbi:MAG TPA: hypothetical protein DD381_01650 [Lentisphaeria bacterium]|nr:MAG: hypothetical protein A2X47_10380 [Lentisphaerae bacterium GWF2_38_69]HBM15046.1 hypothetical protein [Lentisphaeria bacterium]